MTNHGTWSRQGVVRRKPAEKADVFVAISDTERLEWRAQRNRRGLSTRALAKLAGTSNGTITNIETAAQRQAKRTVYMGIVRALYDVSAVEAAERAAEAIARNDAAYKRLVAAISGLPIEQVESLALGVETGRKLSGS